MRRAGEQLVQIRADIPRTLVEKLDKEMRRMAEKTPWARISRSDAIRALLSQALNEKDPVK